MPLSAPSDRREGKEALVLVARRRDLLDFRERAHLPLKFFAVYEGDLTETAGGSDEVRSLDWLLGRYSVVGVDADLLLSPPGEDDNARRYHQNFVQKLASRRVALLMVLRGESFSQAQEISILRQGESGSLNVRCVPADQTIADWQAALSKSGLCLEVVDDKARGLASLLMGDSGAESLIGVRDFSPGRLAELLGFAAEQGRGASTLRSRWFPRELAHSGVKLTDVLKECERLQEQEELSRVLTAWGEAVANMQEDTQGLTHVELIVIAHRSIDHREKQLIESFNKCARIWMMTEDLRVAGDRQTAMLARHVWCDSVGPLLARLRMEARGEHSRGMFAWRSFLFGVPVDDVELERVRANQVQSILAFHASDAAPELEHAGMDELSDGEHEVPHQRGADIDWEVGNAADVVRQHTSELSWCADHCQAGRQLAEKKLQIDRAAAVAGRGNRLALDSRGGERDYSQECWQRVRSSPGNLRALAAARLYRGDDASVFRQRFLERLDEWRRVLGLRAKLAQTREELQHEAEELDRARKFHVGMLWRFLIGSVVAVYTCALFLNVLRVIAASQPSAWGVGAWFFVAALTGGWLGALLPMLVEAKVGRRAAKTIHARLHAIDDAHREAVQATHDVFRDAEGIHQNIRMAAVHRRTTLLAKRAWSIVRDASERVTRDLERRASLSGKSGASEGADGRLAREDRQDWRSRAIIRPVFDRGRDIPEDCAWDQACVEVSKEFCQLWKDVLQREDPHLTGFLRVTVLQAVVNELASLVGERLEQRFLEQAERNGSHPELAPKAWIDKVVGAVGVDASSHAMLSVRDVEATQRVLGIYRLYRRNSDLAEAVCNEFHQSILNRRPIDSIVVESHLPGGFAMVFHEVPLFWRESALSTSEFAGGRLYGLEEFS